MLFRGLFRLWVVLAGLFGAGCVAPSTGFRNEPLPEEVTFWQPWRLNSSRTPYRKLHVEVDAVRGAEPPQAWLDELGAFLREQCDKPEGVRVVRSDLIAPAEASSDSITSLALRYLDGPPPGSAFLYVFYYNSALNPALKTANPHAVVFPYPCAVFVDRNYNEAGFGDILGGLILKHEAAHLVGAARNPAHGDGAHCRNRDCLMNPVFNFVPELVAQGRVPTSQTDFCKDCLEDMAISRSRPAPVNLRFQGPFLVRREMNYTVMTLPNSVHLHLGNTVKLPASQLRAAVRQAAAGPLRSREGFILSVSASGSPAEVAGSLSEAAQDPAAPVRQAAQLFAARMAAGPVPP
jgi:hypothetical protein